MVRSSIIGAGLSLLFLGEVLSCTVPVFRYALDRWQGKPSVGEQDLPVLAEIADRILSGDSAVFVQIDSGDRDVDDAVFQRLAGRLQFFESVAELPEIDPNDPASQLGPGPDLVLRFSTIRVAPDDPVVNLITGGDKIPEGEVLIAPVFGRGRVLGAWPGSMMDEEGIDEVCHYLTGACSCQVKAQNPGWDLAMNVDWDERLLAAAMRDEHDPANDSEVAPIEVTAQENEREIETVTFPGREQSTSALPKWLPYLIGSLLLGGGLLLLRKK